MLPFAGKTVMITVKGSELFKDFTDLLVIPIKARMLVGR
jgi:hypothetical protein